MNFSGLDLDQAAIPFINSLTNNPNFNFPLSASLSGKRLPFWATLKKYDEEHPDIFYSISGDLRVDNRNNYYVLNLLSDLQDFISGVCSFTNSPSDTAIGDYCHLLSPQNVDGKNLEEKSKKIRDMVYLTPASNDFRYTLDLVQLAIEIGSQLPEMNSNSPVVIVYKDFWHPLAFGGLLQSLSKVSQIATSVKTFISSAAISDTGFEKIFGCSRKAKEKKDVKKKVVTSRKVEQPTKK